MQVTLQVASSSRTRDIHLPCSFVNPIPCSVNPSWFTRLESHAIKGGAFKRGDRRIWENREYEMRETSGCVM